MLGYVISDKEKIKVIEHEIQSFDILHKTYLNIFIIENGEVLYKNDIIDNASKNGHVQVLEWFKLSGYEFKYTEWEINHAAGNGHVQVLEWFKNSGYEFKYDKNAINLASFNGYVQVLEWFKHSGYKFKYDKNAINYTSRYGCVQVLKWFKQNNYKTKKRYFKGYKKKLKKLKITNFIMNIHEIKIKGEEYKNGNLYVLNNIDSDILNEHSEFLLGSISKLFTAFVFLILNEKKIISIDDDVGVFLKNDNFKGIKIIELLNHVSGLKRVPDNIENFMSQNEYTKASEVYETFKDSYLKIYEKETFNYSNIGYIILGTILEKKMNKSYFKVIEEYILTPLNMTDTNINNNNIRLYGPELEKYDFIQSDRNYASSAGAFHGSVSDFIKFQNVVSLISDKNMIKKMYFYKNNVISHSGCISGGKAVVEFFYDNNFNPVGLYVKFKTAC